jgi:NADH:ubiquinone oxidoreductase subunit D
MDRTRGVGPISAERAMEYGFTGPNLRAAGVDYDVRVMNPYSSYQDFDFIIPVGVNGDTYDRFMVRQEEIRQSLRIIEQAYSNLPEGSYKADVPDFYLPPKSEVYNNMEALIYHFKIEWARPKSLLVKFIIVLKAEMANLVIISLVTADALLTDCSSVAPVLFTIRLIPK